MTITGQKPQSIDWSNEIMSEKESILHCVLRPTKMNDDPITNKKNKAVYIASVAPSKAENYLWVNHIDYINCIACNKTMIYEKYIM